MIVITLTDCPPRLRGDLSKWLMEINTGVYVGQVSQRVREELWKRVCQNLPKGRATMVYSANNEQRMSFQVHNTTWRPVDFEGLTLMRRPSQTPPEISAAAPASKVAVSQMVQRKRSTQTRRARDAGYVVVDIETTGLDPEADEILELGAIRVVDHEIRERFSTLVRPRGEIPREISALTGITGELALAEGTELAPALESFWSFVGDGPMVGYNLAFDRAFLGKASAGEGIPVPRVPVWDVLTLARRRVRDVPDHRLDTLVAHFGVPREEQHRALADCVAAFHVYEKLNEN